MEVIKMIYGNVIRQYENNVYYRGWGRNIVDEGGAILEALQKEYDNYSNMVFNESYFITDREKAINEAKLEAIQEAVTVAIVAAIVAIIGAIIGLLVAAIKIFGKGASAVKSKINTKNAKKLDNLDNDNKKKAADTVEGKINDNNKESVKQEGPLHGLCFFDYRNIIKTEECKEFSNEIKKIKDTLRNSISYSISWIANKQKVFEICPEITNSINKEQNEITDEDIKQAFISHYNKNATKFEDCIRYSYYVKAKECIDKIIPDSENLANSLLTIMKTCESDVKEIQKKASEIQGNKTHDNKLNNFIDNMKTISDITKYIKKFLNSWIWMEQQRLKDIGIYITVCNQYVKENLDGTHTVDSKMLKDDPGSNDFEDMKTLMDDDKAILSF